MIGAFRADLGAALELTRVDQLAAAWAFDPQVLRDLQIGALLVRLFGTKLARRWKKSRIAGMALLFASSMGAWNAAASRGVWLDPRAYGTGSNRARPAPRQSAGRAGGKRPGFWRGHGRWSPLALVPELRDEGRGDGCGDPERDVDDQGELVAASRSKITPPRRDPKPKPRFMKVKRVPKMKPRCFGP